MEKRRIVDMPGMMHLWQVDNLYLAGQPMAETFPVLKELGFKKLINLRNQGEIDEEYEKKLCADNDIDYVQFPIVENGQLHAENCERLSTMLNDEEKFFIHCGSANRVGGWLITHLVTKKGMAFDDAVQVAMESGLSNPGFIEQAREIVNK
jgi:protein tyrosine phosphatase (PTP) superfamily phosphohydrolase (DUF442 family)